jgi:FKBP-type peptidyl-prolyl cis-trans isomerase FklB
MKPKLLTLLVVATAIFTTRAQDASAFKNDKDKFSYALGMYYGNMFLRQDVDVDVSTLAKGLSDVLASNKTLLTEEQMKQTLNDAQKRMGEKRQAKLKEQGEENKKKAEAFLETNKAKDGVVSTPSGLQYKVLTPGTGAKPGSNDTVTVHYKGTLLDGSEFDSSYKRGQPATFNLNAVVKGWTEALQLMSTGSKWELYLPPALAYGEQGRPGIPPNSLLIFDVELLTNAPTPPPAPPAAPAAPLTSDIIKVPSLEEMKKGAKIETIKAADVEKEIQKQQQQQAQPKTDDKK